MSTSFRFWLPCFLNRRALRDLSMDDLGTILLRAGMSEGDIKGILRWDRIQAVAKLQMAADAMSEAFPEPVPDTQTIPDNYPCEEDLIHSIAQSIESQEDLKAMDPVVVDTLARQVAQELKGAEDEAEMREVLDSVLAKFPEAEHQRIIKEGAELCKGMTVDQMKAAGKLIDAMVAAVDKKEDEVVDAVKKRPFCDLDDEMREATHHGWTPIKCVVTSEGGWTLECEKNNDSPANGN